MIEHQTARVLAFYLPQFHPTPENDEWWGKGFTEWTNVVQARPRFKGHYQPRLPSELGFYDLRLPEVREAQADLARSHGVSGFCYYHYWFQGRRLLNGVFDEVLASGTPDFDFCLCWANESWQRNWDARVRGTLVEQTYSPEDDVSHIRWLARAFEDPRYLRVGGRPLFLVYRAQLLPDARRTVTTWRAEARRMGIGDLYLCCVESDGFENDPAALGFDAAVEFPPHQNTTRVLEVPTAANGNSQVFSYAEFAAASQAKYGRGYNRHPCVVPSWDSSSRRKFLTAHVIHGSTPQDYEAWLRAAIAYARQKPNDEQLVFINAWNEWAEGAYLEPDLRYGRQYLEATKRALGLQSVQEDNHTAVTTTIGTWLGGEDAAAADYEVDEAVADALDMAARASNAAAQCEQHYHELESYTLRLMREQRSIRFLSARLVKEIISRLLPPGARAWLAQQRAARAVE